MAATIAAKGSGRDWRGPPSLRGLFAAIVLRVEYARVESADTL